MCAEGERLLRQGQLDAAERQFRNAHALEPRNYNVLNALALIALDRGDATAAIALLTRACELSPDQPTPRVNLGNAFARLGRYDDAIGQYDVALTLRPRDVDALYNRSTALLFSDRPGEAIDGYQRVLGVVPNHAATIKASAPTNRNAPHSSNITVRRARGLRWSNASWPIVWGPAPWS